MTRKPTDLSKGQVVYDKEQGEYVSYIRTDWGWALKGHRAFIFNPRCGEKYWTIIRPLTKREQGR